MQSTRNPAIPPFAPPLRRPACSQRIAYLPWLLVVAVTGLSATALAQEYRTAPVNDRLRLDSVFAQNFAKNPTANPADRERFDTFFTEYYFPAMTRYGPDDLAELGDLRYDLFRRFLWQTDSEPLQRDLTEMAYETMRQIVVAREPAYHPAARYNAILVLGMLDQQYAIDVGANRRPPKPLLKANEFLTSVAMAGAQGKAIPPQLVVGALAGLQRHAEQHGSLPPETSAAMSEAALAITKLEEPLRGMDDEVFDWVKLQAASVLAELGSPGEDNKVHLALMQLIADDSMSLDDRCQAASLLRKISYEGVQLDGESTAQPLVELAVETSATEAKRAKEFLDLHVSGTYSVRRGGRSRGGYGRSEEEEKYERRQLLLRLIGLRRGLTAVKPALPAEEQSRIDALLAAIRPAVSAAADEDTVDLDVTSSITTMADEVRQAAQSGGTRAAEEEPEGLFQ